MADARCRLHKTGVTPSHPPFFQSGCPRCEAKKRAGLVSGDEGMPPKGWRAGLAWVDHDKLRRQMAARQKLLQTLPSGAGLAPLRPF